MSELGSFASILPPPLQCPVKGLTPPACSAKFLEPDQCDLPCPVLLAKIFPFASDPNHFYIPHRLVPQRGGSRVVTNAGRDAVDARAQGVQWQSQGEMNLVSDLAARETIGALADGKAVWSWHPLLVSSSRRLSQPDRVWQNPNPRTTVTRRIRSPGRARNKP
jgi:hypothetical protein